MINGIKKIESPHKNEPLFHNILKLIQVYDWLGYKTYYYVRKIKHNTRQYIGWGFKSQC